jgi:cation transport regulator ChaC
MVISNSDFWVYPAARSVPIAIAGYLRVVCPRRQKARGTVAHTCDFGLELSLLCAFELINGGRSGRSPMGNLTKGAVCHGVSRTEAQR